MSIETYKNPRAPSSQTLNCCVDHAPAIIVVRPYAIQLQTWNTTQVSAKEKRSLRSLLWPTGQPSSVPPTGWSDDLDLGVLVQALDIDSRHARVVQSLLAALTTDPVTIRHRQAVLADLLAAPALVATLEAQLPALALLGTAGRQQPGIQEAPLLDAARRLGELDLYVDAVWALHDALMSATLHSEGLLTLHAELDSIASDATFARLVTELPALRRPLEQLASVTVGINLDSQLRPTGATLVAINDFHFSGRQGLLGRLLGEADASGLTPLRSIDPRAPDPFAAQLFRDLGRLVSGVAETLATGVARYSRINAGALGPLHAELAFYLGTVRLIRRLEAAGLPLATPELLPIEQRRSSFEGLYDMSLALRLLDRNSAAEIVLNDIDLDANGRIAILTGPNRGGKTTFTRAVGLAHVMAQAGLPVPARRASLSPVDAIFSHFVTQESRTIGLGHFDEEARRLAAIFDRATPASLILLNEPLSGTNPEEALNLARGVVRGLQHLGARAMLVTHLHTLARESPAFSTNVPAAPVVSLVASPPETEARDGGVRRSFRVVSGPPVGESRALEIARQHGLSPEQVLERLRARGLLT